MTLKVNGDIPLRVWGNRVAYPPPLVMWSAICFVINHNECGLVARRGGGVEY